jgi:hypothetical protein
LPRALASAKPRARRRRRPARAFERFAPDALAEASVLALQPDPWRKSEEGDA